MNYEKKRYFFEINLNNYSIDAFEISEKFSHIGVLVKSYLICVPKVPFRIFDKLKNEIQKLMIRFCFYLNMKSKIQIIEYYFNALIRFSFS